MLFTMSACSNSTDKALEATATGINNMTKMESASYAIGMEMGVMGETLSFDMHGGYLEKDEKLNISFVADMKESGVKENLLSAYIKDDTLFLDLAGEKAKMPLADIMKSFADVPSTDNKEEAGVTKDDLKPFVKKASMDGNNIELTLDEKKVEAALKEEVDKAAAENGYEMAWVVKSATVTLETKDDFIVDVSLDLDTTMSMGVGDGNDTSVGFTIKLYTQFTDINAKKEIEFPEFDDTYIEISPMDLLGALGQEL